MLRCAGFDGDLRSSWLRSRVSEVNKFTNDSLERYDTYTTEIEEPNGKVYFAVVVNNDSLYSEKAEEPKLRSQKCRPFKSTFHRVII